MWTLPNVAWAMTGTRRLVECKPLASEQATLGPAWRYLEATPEVRVARPWAWHVQRALGYSWDHVMQETCKDV